MRGVFLLIMQIAFICNVSFSQQDSKGLRGDSNAIADAEAEYLIGQELAMLVQGFRQLDLSYLNLKHFDLSSFESIVQQWQTELLKIKPSKVISNNKLRLSQLLDKVKGILQQRRHRTDILDESADQSLHERSGKQGPIILQLFETIRRLNRLRCELVFNLMY